MINKVMRKSIELLKRLHKKIFQQSFPQQIDVVENHHLSADTAKLVAIGKNAKAYLRPSFSDKARVAEYDNDIYLPTCSLTDALLAYKPNILIDIGANIGLSSLALVKAIPTLNKIIGVEAEKENFSVLQKNFILWRKELDIDFNPIYGIASSNDIPFLNASTLPGGVSASGTFMFTRATNTTATSANSIKHGPPVIISNLISQARASDKLIVKVDIEGGEEFLFDYSDNWLKNVAFLSIELHDRFGLPNSSRTIISLLAQNDFAVYPREDTLHCYNRILLSL